MNRLNGTNGTTKQESKVTFTNYKGHVLIVLNPDDRFPFQFGIGKAKLILENLEAIRMFVADLDK